MMALLKKIFDYDERELRKFTKMADKIIELEEEYSKLSDNKLKAKTEEFKKRLEDGETFDDIIIEAFATAREACYRVINEKPFKVQLIGGLALHYGNIAEMKTGEGKTLTSVMPAYLNALGGKGVHIVTVNEYLAERDSKWMGAIHEFLGVSVGLNLRDMSPDEKRAEYDKDILYSTNNEIGFDYLRDNMAIRKEDRVQQRGLNYAIVDEVDSILIDEARTPLIISGGFLENKNLYLDADRFAKSLNYKNDIVYDAKLKRTNLSDEGVKKAERYFHVDNLYDVDNSTLVHFINQALHANYSQKVDVDYVVKDGKIVIVDQFTGRLMPGRAFSDGLHQALEAKEGVEIQQETKTLATITFQNLFRMYNKLSGMTGTAKTEEEEFRDIYNMYVISIPTNMPVIREDMADLIYASKKSKFKAIIDEIEARHKKGQPVLVGTIAIETSEEISDLLKKRGIPHEVLNAKNHAREAEIIAKAGEKGSVTIATNMAGRGTDIKLGEGVKELGGLCVIGTERHESRRIDNQLRGRSGRQGDPGFTQFYIAMDDELMIRFGSERIKDILQSTGIDDGMVIRSKMFSKSVASAQKRVEGNNYDMRKSVLQYDDVMNKQRELIYGKRNTILDSDSIHEEVLQSIYNHIADTVENHLDNNDKLGEEDIKDIIEYFNSNLLRKKIDEKFFEGKDADEMINGLNDLAVKEYEAKIKDLPEEVTNEFEKVISLNVIDKYWMEQITTMSHLKEGIFLRQYAQDNPLRAYTEEGFELFDTMLENIDKFITLYLLKAEIRQNIERKEVVKNKSTNESDDTRKGRTIKKKDKKIGRNDPCPCGSG
ncbi:MAG: preprotein translocase subunit SecA, partial [Bacilli bacterium]|nr:preprotein translocase subunit SecA [Bacilli bacterium]